MFAAVSLTKHIDIDQCKYSGYGVWFDRHGIFSFPGIGLGRNIIIFGVGIGSSPHIDNKKLCLSLHYNGENSYLFVNGTDVIKFKAKDSEAAVTPLYQGNISKDFSLDNMKKTGLNWYVYDFSNDYNSIAVDDILDIHK